MRKILFLICLFITSCQLEDINNKKNDFEKIFSIPIEVESAISNSNEYRDLKTNLVTYDDYINHYQSHGLFYQPDYSSIFDKEDFDMGCIEYLMSSEIFLSKLTDSQREQLLCIVINKQNQKFGVAYTNPPTTRKTGLYLIIQILLCEKEESLLNKISDYCNKHQFQYGISNDSKFNDFLYGIIVKAGYCKI